MANIPGQSYTIPFPTVSATPAAPANPSVTPPTTTANQPCNPPSNPLNNPVTANPFVISWVYNVPTNFGQIELDLPKEKEKVSDGCSCKKCGELYPYAEPNQPDGSLVCYSCRMIW
jgi:hypothetical protein